MREITFRSAIFDSRVRISSWTPSARYAFVLFSSRFSNGSTAMLLPGAGRLQSEFWVRSQRKMKDAETPRISRAAVTRAMRVRRTWRASGEQRCRRAANSPVPGREAGSNASIDSSSDFRGCGTCAALSCSVGSTFDFCARWISDSVRPANGVFPVSANQSVSPNE